MAYWRLFVLGATLKAVAWTREAGPAGNREAVLDCYILEELNPRTQTGCNIVKDYGLQREYNASVLAQLRFGFLFQHGLE